jgi:hypothetical protein
MSGGSLGVETRADGGEERRDLIGACDAESGESLVETEVRSRHDREIDYTEGRLPRRAPPQNKIARATIAKTQ